MQHPTPNIQYPMLHKLAAFVVACFLSWWPMMAIHELGHMVAALATGGTITHFELPYWSFSRTDISPNPSPMITVWSGPLTGVLLPTIVWLALALPLPRTRKPLGFFAGFCLIANGAYISLGTLDRIGDAGDMLRLGTPTWLMWAFGFLCLIAGLACWHLITKVAIKIMGSPSGPTST